MGKLNRIGFVIIIGLFICSQIWAQDFGFGFDDEEGTSYNGAPQQKLAVSISGETSAAIVGYIEEMSEGAENINTRDMFMFSGKLNFLAQSSYAEGAINLKLVPALVPVSIDEAYVRAFFGNLDFTAGLRKLSWGKADQFGPLDIINMPDSSKIFIEMADNTNLMGVKLAAPVIHASYRFGQFSKIEGLLLPSFEIISMAVSSAVSEPDPVLAAVTGVTSAERWMPAQMKVLKNELDEMLKELQKINPNITMNDILKMPDTYGLDYAQAGLRFTTTIGSADVGAQYFYGRMFQPVVKFNPPTVTEPYPTVEFIYNKYHQIGLDYAQVLAGFNIRAEAAANLTEDLEGTDGYVYNPTFAWSFGFDRDLFTGFNLNLQVNETIRLLDDKIGSSNEPFTFTDNIPMPSRNPDYDIEADTRMTATRFTATLSQKFLRDTLELRAAVVWGIEDMDAAVIPALIWTKDNLRAALSGGFFLGNEEGQLGQYKDNYFLKISIGYMF